MSQLGQQEQPKISDRFELKNKIKTEKAKKVLGEGWKQY